jgi:WhiB family transcriptional regulator, redox-sensing transcriptional regulator
MSQWDWREKANCAGTARDVMFPEHCGMTNEKPFAAALELCRNCTVRLECLAFAMEMESGQRCRYGVWGGMTPRQRWGLARENPTTV